MSYLTAKQIAAELDVSLSKAYELIKTMPRLVIEPGLVRVAPEDFTVWSLGWTPMLHKTHVSIIRWWDNCVRCYTPSSYNHLYFVRCHDRIKIGVSRDLDQRLGELQSGCPYELKLVGSRIAPPQIERDVHQLFKHLRVRGEWFRADRQLLTFIAIICAVS